MEQIGLTKGLSVDPVIQAWMEPLQEFLMVEDLVELSAVREQEVGLEIAGKGYEFHPAPALTYHFWEMLCHALSNYDGVTFDPSKQPRVSTRLPGGHRFEAVMGRSVPDSYVSVSIRLKRKVVVSLDDFGIPKLLQTRLIEAMEEGQTMVISGGTSSGKTTFLNLLLSYIPGDRRILTLEDTREVDVEHHNYASYVVSRHEKQSSMTWASSIDHLMRSRPDIVIAGELSIANTFDLISLLDTGHKGFMTTVHSNSCRLALEHAIPKKVALKGEKAEGIADFLKETVDWVIQIQKIGSKGSMRRQVTEIWQPQKNFYWQWDEEKDRVTEENNRQETGVCSVLPVQADQGDQA